LCGKARGASVRVPVINDSVDGGVLGLKTDRVEGRREHLSTVLAAPCARNRNGTSNIIYSGAVVKTSANSKLVMTKTHRTETIDRRCGEAPRPTMFWNCKWVR
jgi:hypothetical protein